MAVDVHRVLWGSPGRTGSRSVTGADESPSEPEVLMVLAALAGEILATGDEEAINDLADALGAELLADHHASNAIEGVLAMVRTYSLRHRMSVRRAPGSAPRRAYDTSNLTAAPNPSRGSDSTSANRTGPGH